jgi:hypothetical protein
MAPLLLGDEEVQEWADDRDAKIEQLRAENEKLKEDKERLDWLRTIKGIDWASKYGWTHGWSSASIGDEKPISCEAIDKEMRSGAK